MTISGLEGRIQNAGKEQIIDLLASRIKNAERTMKNNIALGLYADGTGSGGKEIGGLRLLVPQDPTTGTVGGINRATWSFWRNQTVQDATMTAATIQAKMQALYLACSRGRDQPDLIMADNNAYSAFWQSLTPIQRITNTETANAGFKNLEFVGVPVVFDGGIGGGCPANTMYFLNDNSPVANKLAA